MRNIILIGMPGTGKSTVGVILAKRLGYDFIDVDLLIIKKTGKTLPEIIADVGVGGFLAIENQVGKGIHCTRCVVATGGSMVLNESAMEHLSAENTVIWLDTDVAELEQRIENGADRGIAMTPGTTVAQVYADRKGLYEKYADIHIKCENGTDRVVSQIRDALGL
ncbi:MAG TPA: shikimate kinase [Clostridiales bacterium]|nr:shikimate kinase [Clostridiales bacterium]